MDLYFNDDEVDGKWKMDQRPWEEVPPKFQNSMNHSRLSIPEGSDENLKNFK
jgi:hypothetical protein